MNWLTLDLPQSGVWERFRDGAARVGESAARAVVGRWQRVRALGADPEEPTEPIDDGTALCERRDRLGPLLTGLPEVLDHATRSFAERDFVLLLADAQGVVVEQAGGGRFADEARRVRLIPGSHWSEATRGTNAIGTAIAESRPVAVHGEAHWARPNHGLVCYASPVVDATGELVAVLDATSFVHRADPFARLAVQATAHALSERLRAYAYAAARPISAVERLVDGHAQAAALVERSGRVRRSNGAAGRWLAHRVRWDWAALHAAARSGDRLPLCDRDGQVLDLVRVEPILDARQRTLAVVVLADASRPRARVAPPEPFSALHGTDATLHATRRLAARLAPTPLPLLLLAETGTGKDLLARAIHAASARADGPFVALNCGALTSDLLDSELFGYGPGAFTGALAEGREGYLAAADGGTLFLDEVAEMPPSLQARLLRFLECGAYHRVGEVTERRSDVRLLCATCRDLPALVEAQSFRSDLYYRIRGATLTLPPVRARDDVTELARELLADLVAEQDRPTRPRLTPDAVQALAAWSWPGNIRELKNALRVALILADGPDIALEHLPAELRGSQRQTRDEPPQVAAPPSTDRTQDALAQVEAQAVDRALAASDGNVSEAARRLGVARSTLYRMMARHGIR